MMNSTYYFAQMRELLDEFAPSRERSLAATKLDECEMWLAKCQPTKEAAERDMTAPDPRGCPDDPNPDYEAEAEYQRAQDG